MILLQGKIFAMSFFRSLFNIMFKLRIFLFLSFVFWLVSLFCVFRFPKIELHLALNSFHSKITDVFFSGFTALGNSLVFILLLVFIYFRKREIFVYVLVYGLILLLTIYFLKRFFDFPRPKAIFDMQSYGYLYVEGTRNLLKHSFPSGHTAVAFAVAFVSAYIYPGKAVQLVAFLYSLLVGYSRIYLSQHFLEDVLTGSFVAIVLGMIIFAFENKNVSQRSYGTEQDKYRQQEGVS